MAPLRRYMIIERFPPENLSAVYDRFREMGRMLPPGLHYVDSWLADDDATVFQVMETADPALFETWFARWSDLVTFEIVPLRDKPA